MSLSDFKVGKTEIISSDVKINTLKLIRWLQRWTDLNVIVTTVKHVRLLINYVDDKLIL